MEGAFGEALPESDFARAEDLNLARATIALAFPNALALGGAFRTGIDGFAKAAVWADSKSKCNKGALGTAAGGTVSYTHLTLPTTPYV